MEQIILFYDTALIYSPNIFFIFLLLLFSFIALLTVNISIIFVKTIRYVLAARKRKNKKKKKNKRIDSSIKAISNTYMNLNRKKMTIMSYVRKIVNKVEKEVFIDERE